jgi:hypothetical protein
MNRQDAIDYMGRMIGGTHENSTHNHYADAKTALNEIYDDIEKTFDKQNKIAFDTIEKHSNLLDKYNKKIDENIQLIDSTSKLNSKLNLADKKIAELEFKDESLRFRF